MLYLRFTDLRFTIFYLFLPFDFVEVFDFWLVLLASERTQRNPM